MLLIFMDQRLIDAFLAEAGQYIFQGSDVFNLSPQALLHAVNQIGFFDHGARVASVLLSGAAIIIEVFFSFVSDGFPRHFPAAAAADQDAGKNIGGV